MGRVFTSEELLPERLPNQERFTAAAEFLLRALQPEDQDAVFYFPRTHGALVFGSTTTESTTVRSDLDILIAYEDDDMPKSAKLLEYRAIFWSAKEIFNVPVESTVESISDLRNGNHSIDGMFLPNLRTVSDTWSAISNPVRHIEPHTTPAIDVFTQYSKAKERKLGKALTDTTELDTKALQRALELPVALARKAIAVLTEHGALPAGITPVAGITKRAVIERMQNLPTTKKVSEPFTELLKIDAVYTEIVQAFADGDMTIKEHEEWLELHNIPALTLAIDYNDALSRQVRMFAR